MAVAALVLLYPYVLTLDTRLIYHADGIPLGPGYRVVFPIHRTGWEFLAPFLTRVGGPADYTATALCQYFYHPHGGAVVLTLVSAIGLVAVRTILRHTWRAAAVLPLVVPVLLAVGYGGYAFNLADLVALSGSLLCVTVYLRIRGVGPRVVLFAIALPVLWYVAGAAAALFAVVCGLTELLSPRRRAIGAGMLVAGGLAGLVVVAFGASGFAEAYGRHTGLYPWQSRAAVSWILLAGNVFIIAVAAGSALTGSRANGAQGGPHSGYRTLHGLCAGMLVLGAGIGIASATLDRPVQARFRANYAARNGNWHEVLRYARQCPPDRFDRNLICDVNRALFETGDLPTRQFAFPQRRGPLLPLGLQGVVYRGSVACLVRLGACNEAEHVACETLEVRGPHPMILRDLALLHLGKQQPAAARVFLNALRQDLIFGRWAQHRVRELDEGAALSPGPAASRIWRNRPPADDLVWFDPERVLLALLTEDRENRMAFEYLMAHYLLTRQLEKFTKNFSRLKDFDYDRLPEHYAEAALFYANVTGRAPDLHGWQMPPSAVARYQRCVKILERHHFDAKVATGDIEREMPHSYFRYVLTDRSGQVRP